MSRDRGVRLQNALAAYLRCWWPSAESAGSGRQGRDILGTLGVWFENKAESIAVMCKRKGGPASYVRQAAKGAGPDEPPVVVWWPPGVGAERPDLTISMLPTPWLMKLLDEAGYLPFVSNDKLREMVEELEANES